jgi:uncharacterized protein (DUF1501 family)
LLQAAAASGLLAALERNFALAQAAPDYKALVCINLQGGNDGENMVIPYDNAGYQAYAAVRTPESGINIPQGQLQPIQPASLATPFGFHPSCALLKTLFDQKKLAVMANVGMLAQPSTRAGLESHTLPQPANLFSHSDQQTAVQSGDYAGLSRVGWGGRIADLLDPANQGVLFPSLITMAGMEPFPSGRTSIPLAVSIDAQLTLEGSGDSQYQFDALRDAALREIVAQTRSNIYDIVAQELSLEGLAASSVVVPILQNQASVAAPFFTNLDTPIARQLRGVAQLIEARQETQLKRQVFFLRQDGYDTHASEAAVQGGLLGDLSQAVDAFQKALTALGLADNVTTFTLSEFGRTFKPASNQGTDHGWGNYHFVIGNAVRGGDFYGKPAVPVLNGPDDLGGDGRWIPTTSIEQYGATLARWFGIADSDLPYIFPNIGAFPNTDLGFMG